MIPLNPILEEIYAAREKLLSDVEGDLDRYLAGVRQRELASGRLRSQAESKNIGKGNVGTTVVDSTASGGYSSPATR